MALPTSTQPQSFTSALPLPAAQSEPSAQPLPPFASSEDEYKQLIANELYRNLVDIVDAQLSVFWNVFKNSSMIIAEFILEKLLLNINSVQLYEILYQGNTILTESQRLIINNLYILLVKPLDYKEIHKVLLSFDIIERPAKLSEHITNLVKSRIENACKSPTSVTTAKTDSPSASEVSLLDYVPLPAAQPEPSALLLLSYLEQFFSTVSSVNESNKKLVAHDLYMKLLAIVDAKIFTFKAKVGFVDNTILVMRILVAGLLHRKGDIVEDHHRINEILKQENIVLTESGESIINKLYTLLMKPFDCVEVGHVLSLFGINESSKEKPSELIVCDEVERELSRFCIIERPAKLSELITGLVESRIHNVCTPQLLYEIATKYSEPSGFTATALNYYSISANKGLVEAQYKLGEIYENGQMDVVKNPNKALGYYALAASQGLVKAQYKLGEIYENGQMGVVKNPNKALDYYALAANKGCEEAEKRINILQKQLTKKPINERLGGFLGSLFNSKNNNDAVVVKAAAPAAMSATSGTCTCTAAPSVQQPESPPVYEYDNRNDMASSGAKPVIYNPPTESAPTKAELKEMYGEQWCRKF